MSAKARHDAAPRSRSVLFVLGLLCVSLVAGLLYLGTWQVQRRAWKLDLIARVEQRVAAAPVPLPDGTSSRRDDEYLKVVVDGRWLRDREVRVQAVTVKGPGFWVMTPLQVPDGRLVLVNRGFVTPQWSAAAEQPASIDADAPVRVTGLLRLSEPGGGFLRDNDAGAQRWYSRDVQAIASAQGLPLDKLSPWFVDADARTSPSADPALGPVGGLTVLRFHNSHLVYAITWYTLALMVAAAGWMVGRQEWSLRRRLPS